MRPRAVRVARHASLATRRATRRAYPFSSVRRPHDAKASRRRAESDPFSNRKRHVNAVAPVAPRRAALDTRALAADVAKVSFEGASAGTASLDLKTASPDVAKGLVHKYVVMVRQNARRGTASTLTKSEVRGGGRKPFKQKGTGNARAGSTRTPLKPGGGVIFGPKPKDWSIKMNKKERRLAMATAIQSASSAMIVVDAVSYTHLRAHET